jgi:protein TonB
VAVILLGSLLASLFSTAAPALEVMRVDLTQLDLAAPQQTSPAPITPPRETPREAPPLPPEQLVEPEPAIAQQPEAPRPKLPPVEEQKPEPGPKTSPEPVPPAQENSEPAAAQPEAAVDETAPQSISEGTSMRMRAPQGVADYYFALLSRKISRRWETTQASGRGRREVETVIRFRVGPSGEIFDVEVASSSGLSVFDRQCLAAVQSANPLPAPPVQYVRGGNLPIELTFTFNP